MVDWKRIMSASNVNSNKKISNSPAYSSQKKNTSPAVNIKNLQGKLQEMYKSLENIRGNKLGGSNSNNSDSTASTSKSSNYNPPTSSSKEAFYLGKIYEIQAELQRYTKGFDVNNLNFQDNQSASANQFSNSQSSSLGFLPIAETINKGLDSFIKSIGVGLKNIGEGASKAADWFVSQFKGESNTNENTPNNQNCGLAAVVMAARMSGKLGGGSAEANDQIEMVRKLSGASQNENEGLTSDQIAQGARGLGLNAKVVTGIGPGKEMREALAQGKQFIAAVDPSKYDPSLASTGHAVLVTAIDGDKVTLFDPAKQKPITVPLKDFARAMAAKDFYSVQVG